LRNDDAQRLQAQASVKLPYETVNPYAFEPAIAPHIAAAQSGVTISIDTITAAFHKIRSEADITLVEGVGGWQVPLNDNENITELAHALALPVILVVGLRLGCINHALLTAGSIRAAGCTLKGWIANHVDPQMQVQQDNIEAIKQRIGTPLLGEIPYMETLNTETIAAALNLAR
jgi:dethiobiotin synthetase